MDLNEYSSLDAIELAAAVQEGRVTAGELTRLALEAAARVEGRLNALAETYDEVPDDAADSAARHNAPFAGVPFLFKDAGAAQAGRRQEFGSRLLAGRVVSESSWLAERFERAGLVAVGRSNVPEFTLSLSTESVLHGPTRNPWDTSLHAGGSSGGAAAAVVSGVVPIAHATDTAGSIRIPASACGLVGLKPSRGRVSHGPGKGEPFMGMDVEFIVSRSVRDSAAMLDAVAGPAPGDPFAVAPPDRPFLHEIGAQLTDLRIAVTTEAWGGYDVDPEVETGTLELVAVLEHQGHNVENARPRLDYDAFVEAAMAGWALGFDVSLEEFAREMGRPIDDSTLEPVTLSLLELAKRVDVRSVVAAEQRFTTVRRDFGRFFDEYDLLITPTLLRKPEPLGRYSQEVQFDSFEEFFRHCDAAGAMLPVFNVTGQPAISLPLAWSKEELPIGVQFVARVGDEALLLRVAALMEALLPWRERRPGVHAGSES